MPIFAPYGTWKSPISSDQIVAGSIGLGQVVLDGEDIYWIESRPAEKGRSVIVRYTANKQIEDVTPAPYNVRTRVHEYGGGAYTVNDGVIYFSNFADNRVYRQELGADPEPLTPEMKNVRYADFILDRFHNSLICVCEDHRVTQYEPINSLVSINLDTGISQPLVTGADFFASPRLSPDGNHLAWVQWNHPNMPWDESELMLGDWEFGGTTIIPRRIAGGPQESVFQPEWSPDGVLHYISDRTGWWNLYRWEHDQIEALHRLNADFGMPQWVFGMSTYAFLDETHILCSFIERGLPHLAILNTANSNFHRLKSDYARFDSVRASYGKAVFIAASPLEPNAVIQCDPKHGTYKPLRSSSDLEIDPWIISLPRPIEFPTENGLTAHAFHYPARNPEYREPAGEKPPLIVAIHGGPTAATYPVFSLWVQYWTTRGFSVLDVNYGGSTGYGRAYRERLKDQWGIVDVDDCVNGAKHLVNKGLADPNRLCITGGSAGGYTTLCALAFRDVFKAGASHYGVSDLQALDDDTHKFESRYTFNLVPKSAYNARSPIHHVDKLNVPVIFFQGLEDKIVPPNQAEKMVDALKDKGLPVAYVTFAEEGHGFRQAANIKRALDGELYFYAKVFGFELADEVEPVDIENLE
ncbi:MAG: S9 family peptidase [Acidobacteria bacterium]|nr:S9 family peptidase [Acidobacteriota bacterium]